MSRIAQCCCGSLRAEALADPVAVLACHCLECQRRTGAPFGVGAYFRREQVRTAGPHKLYIREGQEGRKLQNPLLPGMRFLGLLVYRRAPGSDRGSRRSLCRPVLSSADALVLGGHSPRMDCI